ncbi:uncharacterized protein MONBRDRAFT_5539 [Monosiga brevicollis MX1]|uniref:Profilin n=1 Tax=Monosiga brevicollis TaxID=81824 RepID=A9URR6_MONBE|nr:uncharacterized protein MONBRDRAFT_5539 [Monosiga brevicollis MX1]EDQ91973.1 predicted protein [Monosiga brevicollis MX1]|eukprot:XP_001743259.1 hypothetical protein [Monosiga brevicollis MX1]
MEQPLQELVDQLVAATPHVHSAAIIRRRDAKINCHSQAFTPTNDLKHLLEAFRDTRYVRENNLVYDGRNWLCLRADHDAVYARDGRRGLIAYATANHIVVGLYEADMTPAVCVETIELLEASTLASKGCKRLLKSAPNFAPAYPKHNKAQQSAPISIFQSNAHQTHELTHLGLGLREQVLQLRLWRFKRENHCETKSKSQTAPHPIWVKSLHRPKSSCGNLPRQSSRRLLCPQQQLAQR